MGYNRFSRASNVRVSIKAVSEGLSVLNELKAAEDHKSISPEEAEKLKRNLLKSVDDLFTKGVYTSAMQDSVPTKPTEVEYRRTKLITYASDEQRRSTSGNDSREAEEPEVPEGPDQD